MIRYEACDPVLRLTLAVSAAVVVNGVYCIAYRNSVGDPVPVGQAMAWGVVNIAPWVAAIEIGRHARSPALAAVIIALALLVSLGLGAAFSGIWPDLHELVRRLPGAFIAGLFLWALAALRSRRVTKGRAGRVGSVRECTWVRAAGNYVEVHRDGSRPELVRSTLAAQLAGSGCELVRIHRGFAVATSAIARVERNHVRLRDGTRLPIGNAYRAALSSQVFFAPSSPPR